MGMELLKELYETRMIIVDGRNMVKRDTFTRSIVHTGISRVDEIAMK